jgi:hypothetical protein
MLQFFRSVRAALISKGTNNERATHVYDTERLATEIEMLKFVSFLVR